MVDRKESDQIRITIKFQGRLLRFCGTKDISLQDAFIREHPDHAFDDGILFAKFNNSDDRQVAILPTIQCGWLKDCCSIATERISGKNKEELRDQLAQPIDESRDFNNETRFYIKTDNRKYKESITKLKPECYKYRDLCVTAVRGETFKEALTKDLRFVNVERWEITECDDATLSLAAEAQKYPDTVLKVSVRRSTSRSQNNTSETHVHDLSLKASKVEKIPTSPEARTIKEELIEVDGLKTSHPIRFFTTNYTAEDIRKNQISKIYQLLSPEIANDKKKADENISQLVEKQFSKAVDDRRPACLLDDLARIKNSVGRIFCRGITGTCFLLRKGIIITNKHVLVDILNELKSSTDNQIEVLVWFNHEKPNQTTGVKEVKVIRIIAQSENDVLDYALLALEEKSVTENLEELGPKVRRCVPHEGILTIIGHPEGNEKVEQPCQIMSPYLWRPHAIEQMKNDRPSTGFDKEFILSCKRRVMAPAYEHKIAYGTNFFHGASGSPCINNSGHIVAMHTSGFSLNEENESKRYIVEFGVSFAAICDDLKKKNSSFVEHLFPNIDDVPSLMDTNDQLNQK